MIKIFLFQSLLGVSILSTVLGGPSKTTQKKSFRLHIYTFYGASGSHNDYLLTQDSLIVSYDNDNEGVEMHRVYAVNLKEAQSNSFYEFLKASKPDTLRPTYHRDRWYTDGLWAKLEIETDFMAMKKVNISEPAKVHFLGLVRIEINRIIKKKRHKM